MTNRLCYYDEKNLNNVLLPFDGCEDKAKEIAETLVNMPVLAKYKKIGDKDDLGGHEKTVDKDGHVQFGTSAIGTHVESWIGEPEKVVTVSGEERKLPCLYAVARIWKRNKNVVSAIKRLFDSKEGLTSSWEILTKKYTYANGVKRLDDYEFIGNTLLGSRATPAYLGTAKAISIASDEEDSELMIAEALALDLSEESSQANNPIKEEKILEDKNMETASLTVRDLEGQIRKALNHVGADGRRDQVELPPEKNPEEMKEHWLILSFVFPEDHIVWVKDYEAPSELEFLQFDYTVDEEDHVVLSNPTVITLVASPKEFNEEMEKKDTEIAGYKATIEEKDDLIVKASAKVKEMEETVSTLNVFKEKFEEAEQKRIQEELAEKREALIASVVKSGQISREEIEESEELRGYADNLDKKSFMSVIGERLLASVEKAENVETSSTKNPAHVSLNLSATDDTTDKVSVMRSFLKGRK